MAITKPLSALWEALQHAYQDDVKLKTLLEAIHVTLVNYPNYSIKNNILFLRGQVVVFASLVLQRLLIREYHNTPIGGHAGICRTYHRIANPFVWQELKKDVMNFVNHCKICQTVKPFNRAPQGLLQPLPIPSRIWESALMDFITHLPLSPRKIVILVVVDRLSKQTHFSGLPTQFIAIQVAEIFTRDVIRLHGLLSSLISNRDPLFLSQF